jgi:hypothetical protein
MNPQSARLAWLAFVLLWCSVLATRPRSAAAFEVPSDLGPSIHAALEHLEFALPARPGTHAVEFWNGIVCQQPDDHPDDYHCAAPADIDE